MPARGLGDLLGVGGSTRAQKPVVVTAPKPSALEQMFAQAQLADQGQTPNEWTPRFSQSVIRGLGVAPPVPAGTMSIRSIDRMSKPLPQSALLNAMQRATRDVPLIGLAQDQNVQALVDKITSSTGVGEESGALGAVGPVLGAAEGKLAQALEQSKFFHGTTQGLVKVSPEKNLFLTPSAREAYNFGRVAQGGLLHELNLRKGLSTLTLPEESLRGLADNPRLADEARRRGGRLLHSPESGHTVPLYPAEDVTNIRQLTPQNMLDMGNPMRVSTALPTGARPVSDPMRTNMQPGLAAIAANPKHTATLAKTIRAMRVLPSIGKESNLSLLQRFIDYEASNLQAVYKATPSSIASESKQWYDGANTMAGRWSRRYGVSEPQAAAAIAVTSPKNEWDKNTEAAKRIINAFTRLGEETLTPAMIKSVHAQPRAAQANAAVALQQIGRRFADIDNPLAKAFFIRAYEDVNGLKTLPTRQPVGGKIVGAKLNADGAPTAFVWPSYDMMAKAVSVLQDGSRANISKQLGEAHKVRSFYNNILDPSAIAGDVTADTHAIAATHLLPIGEKHSFVTANFGTPDAANLGLRGTYPLNAEAYRQSAANVGRDLEPRQMQSVTWDYIRRLFPAKEKTEANLGVAQKIWRQYQKGAITQPQAQAQILDHAQANMMKQSP